MSIQIILFDLNLFFLSSDFSFSRASVFVVAVVLLPSLCMFLFCFCFLCLPFFFSRILSTIPFHRFTFYTHCYAILRHSNTCEFLYVFAWLPCHNLFVRSSPQLLYAAVYMCYLKRLTTTAITKDTQMNGTEEEKSVNKQSAHEMNINKCICVIIVHSQNACICTGWHL